mgnify:FL=1
MDCVISSDPSRIDLDMVYDYLSHRSYWAQGRSRERIKQSIDHSMCFGLYDESGKMLGFARVVTDTVVFAYLMDFFILEDYRGKGLGSKMLRHILDQPALQVRLWFLATQDAHPLYERFGFTALDHPERYMFKRDVRYR